MTGQIDVAIIGGGAAGIAAGRDLAARGRSVLLIEALPRLGGRAHTVTIEGMSLDLGGGWLHSADRNPLTALAEAQGMALDRSESAWGQQLDDIAFSARDQREAWTAYRKFGEHLRVDSPASDRADDALPPDHRWRQFIDGMSSFINGTELHGLSVADFIAYDNAATANNWRLPDGYGSLVASLGRQLPVALGTSVKSVSSDAEMTLQTDRGTISASSVIVTVSTAVLARGAIGFPSSVDDHLHAASQLPLGLANKIFLSLADPDVVPAESHLLGRNDRSATGSYYIRPMGRPVVECFVGGSWARELEEAGSEAAADFAIGELRHLLGYQLARGLTPVAVTNWGKEPTILGSYSHAVPGQANARAALARPVTERLCFAGEACSRSDFSTVHGAWASGLVAAYWTERFLAKRGGCG